MAQSPQGRHQASRSGSMIGGAAALAALAVGGAAFGISHRGNSSTSASASTATATSTGSASATGAALTSCRSTVAAGERVATAAAASAKDWRAHAGAQWDLDAGRITYQQAEKVWAASKAHGAQDLQGFTSARAAYDKNRNGCAGTAGAGQSGVAKACTTRAAALAKLATAGDAVNTQWASHIGLMKTKARAAGPGYHMKWMGQTQSAKATFRSYDAAAAALRSAPACS